MWSRIAYHVTLKVFPAALPSTHKTIDQQGNPCDDKYNNDCAYPELALTCWCERMIRRRISLGPRIGKVREFGEVRFVFRCREKRLVVRRSPRPASVWMLV